MTYLAFVRATRTVAWFMYGSKGRMLDVIETFYE